MTTWRTLARRNPFAFAVIAASQIESPSTADIVLHGRGAVANADRLRRETESSMVLMGSDHLAGVGECSSIMTGEYAVASPLFTELVGRSSVLVSVLPFPVVRQNYRHADMGVKVIVKAMQGSIAPVAEAFVTESGGYRLVSDPDSTLVERKIMDEVFDLISGLDSQSQNGIFATTYEQVGSIDRFVTLKRRFCLLCGDPARQQRGTITRIVEAHFCPLHSPSSCSVSDAGGDVFQERFESRQVEALRAMELPLLSKLGTGLVL